ncbi:hypothetical protein Hypma_012756 [Hypsizygus marmoreus]|uniref:Uncharacterized protein n=1 Tax=Hypsizygus marmoreus TaxID=39966 RepID=A0A369JHM1_HYPMA|nr:hypothetical protein Hypma_012756 [Hypsizygus marmoreus]
MPPKTQGAIPPGYVFFNLETFMSVKGKEILEDLLKKAANRNPDAFDMYVYNDFYPYAVLDLVDKTLTATHTKLAKKAYDEAYCLLEALTVFNDFESCWPMCDDGDRTKITNSAYGALVVALLRGLEKGGRLDTASFPALERFLKNVAEWGDAMNQMSCEADYSAFCKAIGKKLFKDKSADDIATEKARVEEWIKSLDKEDQALVRRRIKEKAEEDAADGDDNDKPWFDGGSTTPSSNLALSRIWKEYKQYLSDCPTLPLRGPDSWDISEWTDEEKKEFMFKGGSDEEDDDFA